MAASEQSSSLNVALADGQLSGNRDGRFGSRLCENAVNQLLSHLSMHKAFDEVSDGAIH